MKKCLAIVGLAAALALLSAHVSLARSELQTGGNVYYVSQGDTLAGIAARFGVTVEAILRQNGLPNPDMIYAGQALIIPTSGQASGGGNYYNPGCANYHIVRHGETLSTIAWQYGASVETLMRQNNLRDKDFVYVGQKLCVSGSSGAMSPSSGYQAGGSTSASHQHTVAQGETLSGICERYGVNMWEVARANSLTNASFIQPGQQLAIPGYTPAPAAVTVKPAPAGSAETGSPARPARKPRPDHKPAPPAKDDAAGIYLRLGRNVLYEAWGRPALGLDDCSLGLFDDTDPVRRFTAEAILTNKTDRTISPDWAAYGNVIFHLATGEHRYACKHRFDARAAQALESTLGIDEALPATFAQTGQDTFPKSLKPGGLTDVTFYTHVEENDFVTGMEFTEFNICFDPSSGDRISCGLLY